MQSVKTNQLLRAFLLVFFFQMMLAQVLCAFDKPVDSDDHTSYFESKPSLGLTLSGGGARGLAHVGVLHVIDSLGLQIDFITGTSMGSIVGGMYAAGYSAAEIEDFALNMNWEALFARSSDLSYVHISTRKDHQKFVLELPIEDYKIRLSTGAIEGQQLWNTLNELFLHTYDITDFSRLNIPFACVATDVERGEAVVMKNGNLVSAIRASMAIPSIFTTVEREGYKLIDGGVVNNFPVGLAKEMGAELVIGVNVSQGLRPAHELQTPIDIIYQMGFYSDARSFIKNRELSDIYIEPDLEGYTVASFFNNAEIIEQGKIAARQMSDELSVLVDPKPALRRTAVRDREVFSLVVDSIEFHGLKNVRPWFAKNILNIERGDTITANGLTRSVNRLFATGYFERVHYNIIRCEKNSNVLLILDVIERPFASLSLALQYSSFTGVGLSAKLATNKFFVYNTKASLAVLAGEKPAFNSNITYFLTDRRNNWLTLENKGRHITFPLYENFKAISEYKQSYFRSDLSFNMRVGDNSWFSSGLAYYYQSLAPNMLAPITIEGKTRSFIAKLSWNLHSLNRNSFPNSGQLITIQSRFYFNQRPSFPNITIDGKESSLEDLDIHIRDFLQTQIRWETYIPINDRLTQKNYFQLGYNIKYEQGFINSFNLGGTYPFLENQITFAGLNEYEVISENIAVATLGYQYHVWRSLYASALANIALYDFSLGRPEEISSNNLVLGGGLSIGYDSLIGPFELTFSYSPQTNRVIGYVNLGWMF